MICVVKRLVGNGSGVDLNSLPKRKVPPFDAARAVLGGYSHFGNKNTTSAKITNKHVTMN